MTHSQKKSVSRSSPLSAAAVISQSANSGFDYQFHSTLAAPLVTSSRQSENSAVLINEAKKLKNTKER